MNCRWLVRMILGGTLVLTMSSVSWAQSEGATLYKSKCSHCHGASGEGKPKIKAPALKTTALDVDKITQHTVKGDPAAKPPHNKAVAGVSQAQAKAIAEFVKTLK